MTSIWREWKDLMEIISLAQIYSNFKMIANPIQTNRARWDALSWATKQKLKQHHLASEWEMNLLTMMRYGAFIQSWWYYACSHLGIRYSGNFGLHVQFPCMCSRQCLANDVTSAVSGSEHFRTSTDCKQCAVRCEQKF